MKHYRATPVRGTPGEPIVARGLPALVAQAKEQYGLVSELPSVRANMSRGSRVYMCEGDKWLEITHDAEADAAYALAQENAVVNDDREVDYMANISITSKTSDGFDGVEFQQLRVRSKGLINLFAEAARFTMEKTGGIPDSMHFDAVKERLPNMRSQMSKSRKVGKQSYMVSFPKPGDGYYRTPKQNWESRIYVDIAAEFEPLQEIKKFERR